MNTAKLTVLMPSYNKGKYIGQAIESVLMQKTNFSYELIIIDDKSTDNSLEIAQHYQQSHPQTIRLLTNTENKGCLYTTLKGYDHIKTEYFCVLDPDDYWISDSKLQKAVNFLDAHRDFTLYISNTLMEINNQQKKFLILWKNKDFDFNQLNKAVWGHTSGVVFRNVIFNHGVPKNLYSHIGTSQERYFEGDSFRNFAHLNKGKAHCTKEIESVYRINPNGIWSGCSAFQKNTLNAGFYMAMFSYFDHAHPDYFLKRCAHFLKRNLMLLSKNPSEVELSEFHAVLDDYLKYKGPLKISIYDKLYGMLYSLAKRIL